MLARPACAANLGSFTSLFREPGATALIDLRDRESPRIWACSELSEASDELAQAMLAGGLSRGDRIGILAENSAEYLVAVSGLMKAGLTAVPINLWLPPATIEYILRDSSCKAVFVDRSRPANAAISLRKFYLYATAGNGGLAQIIDRAPGHTHANDVPVQPLPGEIAYLLYTSGSTGLPKGVLLTHEGQRWALEQFLKIFAHFAGARMLVVAPYYHMNGLFFSMLCLGIGITIVTMPRFDARDYIEALSKYRCTALSGIPTMFAMIAREERQLRNRDFSFVRSISLGSAPLTEKLVSEIKAIFPNATVTNGFGTTEGGPYVFGSHPQGLPTPTLSLGYPAQGVEVQLIGGVSADVGTLRLRSPAVMQGYLNLPEQTQERLSDGWYCTGDVMRCDENGFFFYIGRADDMFVCGGENVYPGQIESLLEKHPEVAQAAVVPVVDHIKGHIPVAFVIRKTRSTLSEAELKAYTLREGPAYSHPRYIEFLERLPVASSHKYDRRLLADLARKVYRDRQPSR